MKEDEIDLSHFAALVSKRLGCYLDEIDKDFCKDESETREFHRGKMMAAWKCREILYGVLMDCLKK